MRFIEVIPKNILQLCTYFLSVIIPKNSKIWVFGGWYGERFADNSRYFFQYIFKNKEKYGLENVIWVTRNKKIISELENEGYEVYHTWSFKSIWYHLRSPIFIYDQSLDDLNPFFLHRGNLVYLWHGFPLKRIGKFTHSSKNRYSAYYLKLVQIAEKLFPGLTIRYGGKKSYLLAQSEFASKILREALDIPNERTILAGYPRNDLLTQEKSDEYYFRDELIIISKIKKLKDKGFKICFYAPTFRDNAPTMFFGTTDLVEIQKLQKFLINNYLVLITKFHFANHQGAILKNEPNFINLDSSIDIYPFLPITDILITDYSSIAFDFLYLNRPIIYFPYDLEYYTNQDRGLLFDYEDFTPGPKVYNLDKLKNILKEFSDDSFSDKYFDSRKHLLEMIHNLNYLPGSPMLAEKIKAILMNK